MNLLRALCVINRGEIATYEQHHEQNELHRLTKRVAELETEVSRLKQHDILKELRQIMADAASILAKVTANTSVTKSIALAVDGLKEGQTDIASEIAELKRQIAEGQAANFDALDAAADEQATIIDGLKTGIGANTQPTP